MTDDAFRPPETCEACGGAVGEDAVRLEANVDDLLCPTPLTFHAACYDAARAVWAPDVDSLCSVDPEFPETQQWTPPAPPAVPFPNDR